MHGALGGVALMEEAQRRLPRLQARRVRDPVADDDEEAVGDEALVDPADERPQRGLVARAQRRQVEEWQVLGQRDSRA